MTLRVLYRTIPGDNPKGRPDFYSKRVCALSLAESLQKGSDSTCFVINDAPDPGAGAEALKERLPIELVTQESRGNAGTYRQAVEIALEMGRPGDLIYFAEDDYLYHPDAFPALVEAAETLPPHVGYLTLFEHPNNYNVGRQGVSSSGSVYLVGSQVWRSVISMCMTFAVRIEALRADCDLHFRWSRGKHPNDFALSLALQSGMVGRSLLATGSREARKQAQKLARRAIREPGAARLVTACPSFACHLGLRHGLAPGRDWEALAASVPQ